MIDDSELYEDVRFRLLQDKPGPEKNFTLCSDSHMDFSDSGMEMKKAVFWFTVPMLVLDIAFLMYMVTYTILRFRKLKRSNWLTQI